MSSQKKKSHGAKAVLLNKQNAGLNLTHVSSKENTKNLTVKQKQLLDMVSEYRMPNGAFYTYEVGSHEASVARALARRNLVEITATFPNGKVEIRAL